MRDVTDLIVMFLIALTWTVYAIPVGPRRVRALVGMAISLCAFGVLHLRPIRAPIGSNTEFVLGILFAGIVLIHGLRGAWATTGAAGDGKAENTGARNAGS